MSEWQPIETAPKHGPDLLLCDGSSVHEGRFMMAGRDPYSQEGWYWSGYGGGITTIHGHPSGAVGPLVIRHWMPLPAPPNSGSGGT